LPRANSLRLMTGIYPQGYGLALSMRISTCQASMLFH